MNLPWYFLRPHELEDLGKSVAVSKSHAQKKGVLFNDLVSLQTNMTSSTEEEL
jgi:hypothetical protein